MAVPALLCVASFGLAFAQRPGLATADTKINLHVDPSRFLADAASMWTSTGQLGGVQAGQQVGYLFPMGPFFALGHALGLGDWVVQRLWLGALLFLAAWGVVRLLDALHPAPRGVVHLAAGAVTLLNPFVVTYANRTTVTLLAYAALPWLLLAVHRGLREPRGWRWPAAFALLVAASGGGVNGAVTAWMLVGPALLLLYELLFTPIGWRVGRGFLLRAAALTVLTSLWWIVPAYVQSSYGVDFLHFTEQPGTIWGTTSATESLRLMSFWLSYVGIGFAGTAIPYFDDSRTLLFAPPVVVATLLLPALALTGFLSSRRWRYGPFFLLLALVAVLIMMAGFPEGTPLRHGLTFTYNRVAAVRFLRASYKAAPLLAIALACLAGAGAGTAWKLLESARGGAAWRAIAVLGGATVLALAAWPLVTGRAQDAQVSFKRIPPAWREVAADLDRGLPANSRAIVLPGDLFSFYTWGGTVDPVLPALARVPVAERSEVPYTDLRATDLLWTIDGLVHQQRLLPGQLAPLLQLTGVRSVVTPTDDDLARSDAPAPAAVASELSAQPGFAVPTRSYGPVRRFASTGLGPPVQLPELRRYDLPAARGIVRVQPRAGTVVVDGSAEGLAQLAALGSVAPQRTIMYAGDLSAAQLRTELADGGELVITDSNRRRAFVAASLEQNVGPTLPPDQSVSADGIMLDPFGRGPDAETVASFTGVRSVLAPASPENRQFPEHRPFAALDGDPQTAWLADPTLGTGRRWMEVDFERPIDVPYVDLLPYDGPGGSVRSVEVAGRSFAVHPGWNHLTLGLRPAQSLRVTLSKIGPASGAATPGAGGIRELRIPGISAGEWLRLPVDAARELHGHNLGAVTLTYLFERTTGDDPYHRDLVQAQSAPDNVQDPGDAEEYMRREFELPARRTFSASAWVSVFAQTPDDMLDRLAGYRGPVSATSSGRFDGEPQWRASQALDGDPRTSWIADYDPAAPAWLQWALPHPLTVRVLRLRPAPQGVRRPATVRILWPGGATPAVAVSAGGLVRLPRPVRSRVFRLEILSASAPPAATAPQLRTVGIAELEVAGMPHLRVPPTRIFRIPCGSARVQVGERVIALRISGSATAFEHGLPLAAQSCGAPVALARGIQRLVVQPGPFAVDELRLSSPSPSPGPASGLTAGVSSGAVIDSGTRGRGSYSGVRLSIERPSWLVLGEGYDRGWRAWCGGRALGSPVPIDGYANGWPVGPACHSVRFAFAPNKVAAGGYVVSALAGAVCLLLLALVPWRRRRGAPMRTELAPEPLVFPVEDRRCPLPVASAVLWALAAAAAFGFVFGLEAGAVSLPVIAFVLWRGVGARTLTLAAGILLGVVVPVLYLAKPGQQHGGNHYAYATQHMSAHWVGVAALGLLIGALWRTLAQRSNRTGDSSGTRVGASGWRLRETTRETR
jgi:arabinofuranan 3-O-arabinosyltransferase